MVARSSLVSCCCFLALSITSATARPQAASTSSAASNGTAVNTTRPLGERAHHGLQADWTQHNSIYVGFLPDWSRESPIDINRDLGKPMAIIGDYIDIREDDLSLSQVRYHSSDIVRLKDTSLYAPAIRPRFTLDKWTDDMSTAVANMAKGLNDQGVTVWLRFAWEMNGDWYEYGGNGDLYVAAFRNLADKVRATTNETYMLWSPNVRYGETDSWVGYKPYYPGVEYVDVAGLSLYKPGDANEEAPKGSFVDALSSFYRLYGQNHPIIISETAAPYTYSIPSSLSNSYCNDCDISGDLPDTANLAAQPSTTVDEEDLKISWLNQLVSEQTAGRYPNLTAVCFFNYMKYGSTHGGDAATIADFRYIGGHNAVENTTRNIVGNQTAYQGGYSGRASHAVDLSAVTTLATTIISAVILTIYLC